MELRATDVPAKPPAPQHPGLLRRMLSLFSRERPVQKSEVEPSAVPAELPERQSTPPSSAEDCLHALELDAPVPEVLSDEQHALVERVVERALSHFQGESHEVRAQPVSALRVLNLVAAKDVDLTELTRAVNHDPAMTAAVLRVANSAAVIGSGQAVRTVREAMTRLGTSEIARVAGAVSARALLSPGAKAEHALYAERFARLHTEAAIHAAGAAHLAMELRRGRSDMAYLGGMLHDVGKAISLTTIASLVLSDALPRDLPACVLDEALERMHVEVGTELHLEWSLPQYLSTLCSSHHDLTLSPAADTDELHVVRVTSSLAALREERTRSHTVPELAASVTALGMKARALRVFDRDLASLRDKMREVLA